MKKFKNFLFGSTFGAVIVFIVLFYVITFGVYYLYGPGPEERLRAEESQQTVQITKANQISSVQVTRQK